MSSRYQQTGRQFFKIDFALSESSSGNMILKVTIKSPLLDSSRGLGRPRPQNLCSLPGRIIVLRSQEIVSPVSVGISSWAPHRA